MDLVFRFAKTRITVLVNGTPAYDRGRSAEPRSPRDPARPKKVYLGDGVRGCRPCLSFSKSKASAPAMARPMVLDDVTFSLGRGPFAGAARPQRRRQDHADQHAGRRHAPAAAAGSCSPWPGGHHRPSRRSARAACRHRLGAAGAQHLQVADRAGEPHRCRGPGRGTTCARVFSRCFRAWPSARRNLGNQLSGGEQQMLAVGRALMLNPEAAAARRAARGPGADHRRGTAARLAPHYAR
jgi:hypothetical protein